MQRSPTLSSWRLPFPRSLFAWLPALAAVLLLVIQPVQAQDEAVETPVTYFVQFQPNLREADRAAWTARQGAELVSWMPQINVAELRLPPNRGDNLAAAGADAAAVAYWEPDAPVWAARVITEPAFSYPNKSYAQEMLRIGAAWDVTDGNSSIIIAVIDTGIDPTHPELAGRLVAGYDYINEDDDPSDDNGHGTHVAGIVAAGLDGVGMVGVCPQCQLMPIKALNANNGGSIGAVAQGILYAVDHGARVINLSLGTPVPSPTVEQAIAYAQEHNVVVVAAAGNQASDAPFYPAALPYVIAVGGTDENDRYWAKSNYGDNIDMVAPAVTIYSTYYDDDAGSSTYAYISGTSMSTAFVSGLAGLALSRRPDATGDQVFNLITEGAVDLGAPGKDPVYGYGRIDAYNTLVAANGGMAPIVDSPLSSGDHIMDEDKHSHDAGHLTNYLYLPAIAVP